VIVERTPERFKLPDWVPVLAVIVALILLAWAYYPHAPSWVTDHLPGHTTPAPHSGHPKLTGTTTPFKSPTLTPTTVQIVPLPPSNTPCASGASCIPQPSFAPAS
jgi:hypothetical protein